MTETAGKPKRGAAPAADDRVLTEALHAFVFQSNQGVSAKDRNLLRVINSEAGQQSERTDHRSWCRCRPNWPT
jgi:hypothetical protein